MVFKLYRQSEVFKSENITTVEINTVEDLIELFSKYRDIVNKDHRELNGLIIEKWGVGDEPEEWYINVYDDYLE